MTEDLIPELSTRVVDQFFDFWINPEIKRRQKEGDLPEDFKMHSVQVIMNFGKPIEVRLNNEIKVALVGVLSRPIKAGEQVTFDVFKEITEILLTENDPNAGHFTMILHRGNWIFSFDFRYNASLVINHLDTARQFLDSASSALEREHFSALVDNLYTSVELMAKGLLIMHDQTVLNSSNHGIIHSRYNKWGHLGNTDKRYTKLLNKLISRRISARYLQGNLVLSKEEAKTMIEIAEDMYLDLDAKVPKRAELPNKHGIREND